MTKATGTLATAGAIAAPAEVPEGEPSLRWSSRVHTFEDIERELARIWSDPALDRLATSGDERQVAARTSVMNLVVVARRPEVGEHAAAIIARLTSRHPSRTIIVSTADPDGPPWVDAQVQAHCVLPTQGTVEVCAETIYLTAGGDAGHHPESIIAPLLIHDLPVTVWWPGEPQFKTQQAREAFEMADRLVVDGSTWSGDGLARLRELAELQDSMRIAIADFALIRQSRWREAIASVFDLPDFLPYLHYLRRVAVAYATHDPTGGPGSTNVVKPVYHVAWLASRLGMAIAKPLEPVEGSATGKTRPARSGGSGSGRNASAHGPGHSAAMHRGLAATARDGRQEVNVVIRPVASTMPGGTTLRVELRAERRGSELRADVTAEAETVHARVWVDGIEALDRVFRAPRRSEADLLAEVIESSGPDPVAVGALRAAAELVGEAGPPTPAQAKKAEVAA